MYRAAALVVHPHLKSEAGIADAKLAEAVSLAAAIQLKVCGAECVPMDRFRPATLLGGGKVEELKLTAAAHEAGVIVVDASLSPVQQRNLERAIQTKVIDRTGLILEIFGARAQTKEGRLQVELAHLTYQRSRLVRSWTHLERQRGGVGFMGGPGETQIEADRRILSEKMTRLKRQIADVARTRDLQRERRKKAPYPTVALVGYTNAGKSTLFNCLAGDEATMAADMLFATLDPTIRGVDLGARRIILSDTVGFISDLPTMLVAAFRATLEEVASADLIVHVRDISHPDAEAQKEDTLAVLKDLGVEPDVTVPCIEVLNKIDRLEGDRVAHWQARAEASQNHQVLLSASTGHGVAALKSAIDSRLGSQDLSLSLCVPADRGDVVAWLHAHGDVQARQNLETGDQRIQARLSNIAFARFSKAFPKLARDAELI